MDASPTLDAPRKGDTITAEWAARVADAANAVPHTPEEPGAFASPFGSVPRPASQKMLGDAPLPLPFDVRVWNDAGVDKIYIYIPSLESGNNGRDLVWVDKTPYQRDSSLPGGSSSVGNGWFYLGDATSGSVHRIAVAFKRISGANNYKWDAFLKSGSWAAPNWADSCMPIVEVARVRMETSPSATSPVDPTSYGIVQLHHGGLWLSHNFAVRKMVYNSPMFEFLDIDGSTMFTLTKGSDGEWTVYGKWNVVDAEVNIGSSSKFMFNGEEYAPGYIVDGNGNQVKVLKKVEI